MNTASITHGAGESTRGKVVSMYATLALINLLAWTWAGLVLRSSPALLGTAFLAYSFGQRPVSVGFFFALGHSLTVVVGAAAVALATKALTHRFEVFQETGAAIGNFVSAAFLVTKIGR